MTTLGSTGPQTSSQHDQGGLIDHPASIMPKILRLSNNESFSYCLRKRPRLVPLSAGRRMKHSGHWRAVGHIEAGQSITDVSCSFGVHDSIISRFLWKQFQTTKTAVRKPVFSLPRVMALINIDKLLL
ncbi:hypothetical protein TNCV_522331 [Trichonephila clavipes]|nr:hypothetical protein TNCV_522331 [Trichonephila clavipes]